MKVSLFCWFHHFLDSRAEFVKFFRWYFGPNDDTKRTFWNWLTFIVLQKYAAISNTDLYLSYFDLSYVFSVHNDSAQRGLTVCDNFLHKFSTIFEPLPLKGWWRHIWKAPEKNTFTSCTISTATTSCTLQLEELKVQLVTL